MSKLPTILSVAAALAAIAAPVAPITGAARADVPSRMLPRHVTPETVETFEKGLEYLKNTQKPDGTWSAKAQWGVYPVGVTSLCALALMANGSTPVEGKYSENVRRAMNYIVETAERGRMKKNGTDMCFISPGEGQEGLPMYGHGFAMLFLAECYGCELDARTSLRIRRILEEAARLTGAAQSALGGWYYTPDSNTDEGSVTVTQMQALRAARDAGIKVDKGIIEKAVKYLERCQVRESDGTIGIAYQASTVSAGSRPAVTAAAVVVLYSGGKYDSPISKGCFEYCKRRFHANDQGTFQGFYMYSHFYLAQAMYQVGGRDWDEYYPKIRERMRALQKSDGSWTYDETGDAIGTAVACMVLQLPYNYLPVFQR